MAYDQDLIAGKLRRWETYLGRYRLPSWQDIPDFGLYMEQVVSLLREYLDYLPPELKDEQIITPTAINNYVRNRVMPEPVKKRYYRPHIAYLLVICTLKQSLSLSMLSRVFPAGLSGEELPERYEHFRQRQALCADFFVSQVRLAGASILGHEDAGELAARDTPELIVSMAILSGFSRLLAEKLLLLDGKTLENGGSIELR